MFVSFSLLKLGFTFSIKYIIYNTIALLGIQAERTYPLRIIFYEYAMINHWIII